MGLTSSDGIAEVRLFLTGLGIAHCTDAVVNEGFYTSVDALKVATYAGLLECGISAADATTILTALGGKVPADLSRGPGPARSLYLSALEEPPPGQEPIVAAAEAATPTGGEVGEGGDEVAEFLRMMGLGKFVQPVLSAGIGSIEALVMATEEELTAAGLPPADAQRLVASLDLSEEGLEQADMLYTPPTKPAYGTGSAAEYSAVGQRDGDDEAEEALLPGGVRTARGAAPQLLGQPRGRVLLGLSALLLPMLLALLLNFSRGAAAAPPPAAAAATAAAAGGTAAELRGALPGASRRAARAKLRDGAGHGGGGGGGGKTKGGSGSKKKRRGTAGKKHRASASASAGLVDEVVEAAKR